MTELKNIPDQVSDLASLLFTPTEIAIMLEIDQELFSEGNEYFRHYMKGRLQAEVDLRTSISKLAKAGSSPAQAMMLDILRKSEAKKITEWLS